MKAKLIDLSNLIQTSGYEVAHPENKQAKFLVGVCRPIQSVTYPQCNGSMVCLIESDPGFDLSGASVPLKLASIDADQTNLQIESDFPTVRYIGDDATGCDDDKRKVKVIYICPSGSEVRQYTGCGDIQSTSMLSSVCTVCTYIQPIGHTYIVYHTLSTILYYSMQASCCPVSALQLMLGQLSICAACSLHTCWLLSNVNQIYMYTVRMHVSMLYIMYI